MQDHKKVIGRLNRELRHLRNNISSTEDLIDQQQVELMLKRRRYLGNIRQFYMVAHKDVNLFSEDPNEELRLNRQIRYLTYFNTRCEFQLIHCDRRTGLGIYNIGVYHHIMAKGQSMG